ncbi:hypothetical protein, partial [Helicobacter pullorum]|uniref:hypothetical protein n=1 Tax=Helicobacter pullorum TaxID=35818 RepID=UPI001C53837B
VMLVLSSGLLAPPPANLSIIYLPFLSFISNLEIIVNRYLKILNQVAFIANTTTLKYRKTNPQSQNH